MNKRAAIGIGIGIIVVAIAGAYALVGIQEEKPPGESAQIGLEEKGDVKIKSPGEAEQEPVGQEAEFGIEDVAEVEVEEPEEESEVPEPVSIEAEEKLGMGDKP